MSLRDGRLLCIVGPTASGKSALALDVARAHDGEIVSADSVQIYRGFDIGTGKPSAEERALVPHHLIDVAAADEAWDAARWAEAAGALVRDIRARGKLPIVCGGSFLWVKSLIFGLAEAPPADPKLREQHRLLVAAEGRVALHRKLAQVDPLSAARLNPNDFVRVSRALEVFELGGVPQSRLFVEHAAREPVFTARLVGVAREPAELDRLISARVEAMLDAGWSDEVQRLLAQGYADTRAMGAVGYKQFREHGCAPRAELALAIVRATRVFARRQRTWLRDQPVEWLSPATKLA